jgi:hypothetical protein
MKKLLFILLLLPNLVKAETFNYNQLILVSQGDDNFGLDKDQSIRKNGTINIEGNSIQIDNETFALKPTKKENCFKCKGGMFQMVYVAGRLAYVQHYRFGKIYNYRIQNTAAPDRGRNAG